ncbi:hypothetical protein AB1K62_00810 [Parasphingorhabdus sp. JC815]|uniref:hypothetical protein n=1 Tax=Parasphingorhabdus sp. JC815 TaxID=3232140 RepID=UPI00345817B4
MTLDNMGQKLRVKTLALMVASALCLPSVQAQTVPGQMTDGSLRQLPSVSEYSLPPGDSGKPADSVVQGPVEENSPPPRPAIQPDGAQTTSSVVRPVPVPPTPSTTTNPPDQDQSQPSQNLATPQTTSVDNELPETVVRPMQSAPSSDREQPQPEATTGQPSPIPSDDQSTGQSPTTGQSIADNAPETASLEDSQTNGFGTNRLFYFSGALIFILLAALGLYFWRSKNSVPHSRGAVLKNSASAPDKKPASEPRKPAPKIYSPPNPAETRKPAKSSSASSDGFITSKISASSDRKLAPRTIPPVARPIPQAPSPQSVIKQTNLAEETSLADNLQIDFTADGASCTLLNAVLNYTIKLTNISDQDLTDIRLSGAMVQAETENIRHSTTQSGEILHNIETLSAGDTVTLSGDIRTPLHAIHPITFRNQALFIPLVHFYTVYKDSTSSPHQLRSSFIIGQEYEPPRTKMAPFRLDQGPRNFGPVGERLLLSS